MKPIRILVIAPYEGMAEVYTQLNEQRDDISLSIFTGNLEDGLAIAQEQMQHHFDAIISRGGTAQLIKKHLQIPVIDTDISMYDVLRSIKMAENYSGTFAITGFSPLTDCAKVICNLLRYNVNIVTFKSESDAAPALEELREQGCSLIICDMLGSIVAASLGLSSILVSSGRESCENALNTAVQMIYENRSLYHTNHVFQSILRQSEEAFLIYDTFGNLWFSTLSDSPEDRPIRDLAEKHHSALSSYAEQRITEKLNGEMITLISRPVRCEGETYTLVRISRSLSLTTDDDQSIAVYNQSLSSPRTYLSKYNSANYVGETRTMIESYAHTLYPILILGETGTGKDKAAELIYEDGAYSSAPLFVIDCASLSDRRWNNFMSSDSSPLREVHTTLYFKHANALSLAKTERLIDYCEAANVAKHNRLLFSFVEEQTEDLEKNPIYSWLTNKLQCLVLRLPPLRERTEDLPSISTLYFNQINAELGKQIVGFTPQALKLMQEFPWPHNLDQLHRIIHQLAVIEQGSYIEEHAVRMILSSEEKALAPKLIASDASSLDLHRTLEEINYDIIRMVLQEEHMNREKTALRLGISRSTLWRILKANEGNS